MGKAAVTWESFSEVKLLIRYDLNSHEKMESAKTVFTHTCVLGNTDALPKDTAVPKHADSWREGTKTTTKEYFGPG